HARTKPLGMVTAHYLSVRAFGANATIFVAAAFFLFCAVASVLMMLVAFRWMGFSENAAIDAATLLVLAPSMTLFFPVPDIAYPLLTLTAVAFWWRGLTVVQRLLFVWAHARVPVPQLFDVV